MIYNRIFISILFSNLNVILRACIENIYLV